MKRKESRSGFEPRSESGKLVRGPVAFCQKLGPMCFHSRCVWPNPDQAIQIGSGGGGGGGRETVDYPVNMPDPIRIRSWSAGKHWPEAGRMILAHWLAFGPDPFGQNMAQSARIKSDPGRFCTILSGTSVVERNWVWKWETGKRAGCVLPETGPDVIPDQMCLAKPWPGHPDRIRVGFAQYDPCLLWKNGTESDAGSQIRPILAARWP